MRKLNARQVAVLDQIRARHGGDMPGTLENYRSIADTIGCPSHRSVKESLYALRAKGAVRSEGSMVMPKRWLVND